MLSINNKKEFTVTDERDLRVLPITYFPYESLKININSWSEYKRDRVREYLEPEFTECGCRLGKVFLLISFFFTAVILFLIHNYFFKAPVLITSVLFLTNLFFAFFGKSISILYNRLLLLKKLEEVKNGKFNESGQITSVNIKKDCGCGKKMPFPKL